MRIFLLNQTKRVPTTSVPNEYVIFQGTTRGQLSHIDAVYFLLLPWLGLLGKSIIDEYCTSSVREDC